MSDIEPPLAIPNMNPMKPKRHYALHRRPPHLLHTPRVQHQQITLPFRSIQHHTQQYAIIFLLALRVRHEDGFAGRLRVVVPRERFVHVGIVFDEPVEDGRGAGVGNAVDVAVEVGEIAAVDGRQFDGRGLGGGPRQDGFTHVGGGLGGIDGGEPPSLDGVPGGVAFLADKGAGAGGGGLHVLAIEALDDVAVVVGDEIGDDVGFGGVGGRRLFPGVDGVETKERGGFVSRDDAFAVLAVDDIPG